MNFDIQSLGFPITAALADHARRRLRFVLTRHSDRIQRVVVRLGDENGPRGGVDKFCRIQVYLSDAPVAVIEDIGPDLYAAIDRAADRVGRVIVKHLDRSRIGRRRGRGDAATALPHEFDAIPHPTHSEGERA
ncbi:MAG: HPF/RaiA family ribosome-associated protein [Polaromonas sp.]|uniref:HPF/RaiA family ribosome-associated protein n=1 Tax=Polaromonas sp. TaxID=1869339 RepID=UPI0027342F6B|nr:HPF/RaiA family ribosome-associated protein [Polaromonas sp.]MDP3798651.1 HPF/RaiA family ribosome-associated protein [Polaromonas sp.]